MSSSLIESWVKNNSWNIDETGKKIMKENFRKTMSFYDMLLRKDTRSLEFLTEIKILPNAILPHEVTKFLWLARTLYNPITPSVDSFSKEKFLRAYLEMAYQAKDLIAQSVFYLLVTQDLREIPDSDIYKNNINALYYKSFKSLIPWLNAWVPMEKYEKTTDIFPVVEHLNTSTNSYYEVSSTWIKLIDFPKNPDSTAAKNIDRGIFVNNMLCNDGLEAQILKKYSFITIIPDKITPFNWIIPQKHLCALILTKTRYFIFSYGDIAQVYSPDVDKIRIRVYGYRGYLQFLRKGETYASIVNTQITPYILY